MSLGTTQLSGPIADRGTTTRSGARVLVIFEHSPNGAAWLAQAAELTNPSRAELRS